MSFAGRVGDSSKVIKALPEAELTIDATVYLLTTFIVVRRSVENKIFVRLVFRFIRHPHILKPSCAGDGGEAVEDR